MKCKHCGTHNPDDYIYCLNCGKKLNQKDINTVFNELKNKLNKKVMIAVSAVALVLVGIFFAINAIPKNKETFSLKKDNVILVVRNGNCYVYEEGNNKVKIENVKKTKQNISFDQSTRLINAESDDENTLYVYRNGKVHKISNNYYKQIISDNGEKVFYVDKAEGTMKLYDVKNKKHTTVLEFAELLNNYVLSADGNYLAYTLKTQNERHVYLYSSKGTTTYTTEEKPAGLIGVTNKGEIIYSGTGGSLHIRDDKADTLVIKKYDSMYINKDYTQLAILYNGDLYLCKNKQTDLVCEREVVRIYRVLVPENIQSNKIDQSNNGNVKGTVTHYAIDNFDDKYFTAGDVSIVQIHKNNTVDIIIKKGYDPFLSNDGSKLYYRNSDDAIVCLSKGKTNEFYNEAKVKTLYAYDHVNKGIYFETSTNKICYSDGSKVSIVSDIDPTFTYMCDDGYFYYNDKTNLYATNKGQEEIIVAETGRYREGSNDYNKASIQGIYYQTSDDKIFFVYKAKAKQIVIE